MSPHYFPFNLNMIIFEQICLYAVSKDIHVSGSIARTGGWETDMGLFKFICLFISVAGNNFGFANCLKIAGSLKQALEEHPIRLIM